MRKSNSETESVRKKSHVFRSLVGGLGLLGSVAINPGFAFGDMQITDLNMFRENASSTCVPFSETHSTEQNYVQHEANLFKSALYQSRTFRDIVADAAVAGLNVNYICHSGAQFQPSTLDLDNASLTVNLLREEMNRPYEALLSTHYLFRMKAAELQGVARNPDFTPSAQVKAYMMQYADAAAWTGLAAVESTLERGGDPGREFEVFKRVFPGPAQAIISAMAKMPKDGADHYDEMKGEILKAGFIAALVDTVSRDWVANNALPGWLEERLRAHPDLAKTAGTREFSDDDLAAYGDYLDGLAVGALYDRIFGGLADDPAKPGMQKMQDIITAAQTPKAPVTNRPLKTPANTP